ncbi:MAG: threonine--tRNA ligase [Acidobacteria bacterium]|nr:threonine--tRNA ligase [Acidobacteriota bacterium]MCI0718163.1 threonine--tRNA ligase [Acidobacteriota bacterium]
MGQVSITLPDGSVKSFESGVTPLAVANSVGKRLAEAAIVAKVDGQLTDLSRPIEKDSSVAILTEKNLEALEVYRHSSAHLLALAVTTLFPGTQLGIGPPIENGFYYDFYRKNPFTPEDLEKIEQKMLEFIQQDLPFSRSIHEKSEGLEWFRQQGAELKCELIQEKADKQFSCYTVGTFVDFCLGPHIPSTGKIKAIKLLSIAGAYWKGDEHNKQLQRIYGTAFFSRKELDDYLKQLEEAKKRDHRRIGKELDLFSLQEEAGPGLVFWHPKGALIRTEIEDFWRAEHLRGGYDFVCTPHIAKLDLWRTSGHVDFYRDSMYASMKIDETDYQLKPMNCPFHILIYKNDLRSYRDLPLRWAETGTVYRYERSGVLAGLFRVRGFTQDDAHIFCQPSRIEEEILGVIDFTLHILRSFGFEQFEIFLSTRPDKYVGSLEDWQRAEAALLRAIEAKELAYSVDEGGGAFYGPKIDVRIKDAIGRSWQCSTIQFDFNLPERFDISFIAEDGKAHRPYVVHRALLGSMERFFGVLIEHYAGAFPFWLSPVQVALLPISERHGEAVQQLGKNLVAAQFRAKADLRNEKINLKIRRAQLEKVPFMVVIGDKEVENGTLSVRNRFDGDLGAFSFEKFLELIQHLKSTRAVRP